MYFHGAMVQRVESTAKINEGCCLLYRLMSVKVETRRKPPEGFLMRKEGLDVESVAVVRWTELFMVLDSSWFISNFHFVNLLGHSFGNIWLRLEL